MTDARERLLLDTLLMVADTLNDDFDVIELLEDLARRCTLLCNCTDVGIVLADPNDTLTVVASTSLHSRRVEALQLSASNGPCVDAFRSGDVVAAESINAIARRWPGLVDGMRDAGYQSVLAVPMRLRQTSIGSLNFFRETPGPLDAADRQVAKTIANLTTIGLLQERAIRESNEVRDQLQHALDSRVLIEQAKGFLARGHGVDMATAWNMLRQHARTHQIRLRDVARDVTSGALTLTAPDSHATR